MTARPDLRNRELAAIHIAKAQLGLDRATYEDMLWTVARVRSAADLDFAGRKQVLDHLQAQGFQSRRRRAGPPPANLYSQERGPLLRKIEALLAASGRHWFYADGIAKRMFKIELVRWCAPDQLHKVVAALEYDAKRRARREENI